MSRNSSYMLRFDDICPTMNWSVWARIEEVMDDHEVHPILAIVPDNRDEQLIVSEPVDDFWDRVRDWQARDWTIAIHGYRHCFETDRAGLLGLNAYSEFAGVPIERQRQKLTAALDIFRQHGVNPEVWVAPAHSFDRNTITVLMENGIKTISDGFSYRIVKRFGCTWIPQQLWRFREMPFGLWTVCLHPNAMTEVDINCFERDLENFRDRLKAYREVIDQPDRIYQFSMVDASFEFLWRNMLRTKRRLL